MKIMKTAFVMAKGKISFLSTHILLVLLVASTCKAKNGNDCPPSSCGHIRNISYPFRLKDDPKNCGHSSYELECENNHTILNLNSKIYYVQAINYEKYLIRVADLGLDKANLCSFPFNILEFDDIPRAYFSPVFDRAADKYRLSSLNDPIIFVSCAAPAKSPIYVNTTICRKDTPSNYSYVLVGDVTVAKLENSCSISKVAWVSGDIRTANFRSFPDIHGGLSYGFELRWFRVYCKQCEARGGFCQLGSNYVISCSDYCDLNSLRTIRPTLKCLQQILLDTKYFLGTYMPNYRKMGIIIGLCFAARFLLGLLFLFALIIYKTRRWHLSMYENIENFLQGPDNLLPIRYTYSHIRKMTNNFSDKLGEGGFGAVFKGKLRSGSLVAVKMLCKSKASGQEFINEVATIGRIHHVNVVKLIGFCFEGSKHALVYEFMPNGSLEKYIFSSETISLSFEKMFEIALGVARGIDYLHTGCDMQILHFDIKPHNILLDENFTPKVSDFGLAKLYPTENSIVSLTAARGTLGYMAPELFYKNIGGVSHKADIYSFGMLLMEMAGKRRNLNPQVDRLSQIYFPSWAYDQISEGKSIGTTGDFASEDEKKMVKKIILVALWCIQMKPSDRPSLSKVIEMLEGDLELLEMPPKPFHTPDELADEDDGMDPTGNDLPLLSADFTRSTSASLYEECN